MRCAEYADGAKLMRARSAAPAGAQLTGTAQWPRGISFARGVAVGAGRDGLRARRSTSFYAIFSAVVPTAVTKLMFVGEASQMSADSRWRASEALWIQAARARHC